MQTLEEKLKVMEIIHEKDLNTIEQQEAQLNYLKQERTRLHSIIETLQKCIEIIDRNN